MTMSPEHHATWGALLDVGTERRRQDELRDAGRFKKTLADPDSGSPAEKLTKLVEEVGEVAIEALAVMGQRQSRNCEGTIEGLRKELVQVAAVAVAWVEALDRELRGEPC